MSGATPPSFPLSCFPNMCCDSVDGIVAAARTRCFFERDGMLNVDADVNACDLAHVLAYMDHFRLVGQSSAHAFDIQCGCNGLRIMSLAGYDAGALRDEFQRTVALILDTHMFEDVAVHVTPAGALAARLGYSYAGQEPPVGGVRMTPDDAGTAWFAALTQPAVAYEFSLEEWSLDLRTAMFQMVLLVLHDFDPEACPIVLRFYDCTADEEGHTDMLLRVHLRTAPPLSEPWDVYACPLARLALMEQNYVWQSVFLQTDFTDVFLATAKYQQRLYWDGYSTSLGFSKDIVAVTRLTTFLKADLEALAPHIARLAAVHQLCINLSTTETASAITIDLRKETNYCGHERQVILARATLPAFCPASILEWLRGTRAAPLRFVAVHMRAMAVDVRKYVVPFLALPLWAATRYGRLYSRLAGKEVVIQIGSAINKTGTGPLHELLSSQDAKPMKSASVSVAGKRNGNRVRRRK